MALVVPWAGTLGLLSRAVQEHLAWEWRRHDGRLRQGVAWGVRRAAQTLSPPLRLVGRARRALDRTGLIS